MEHNGPNPAYADPTTALPPQQQINKYSAQLSKPLKRLSLNTAVKTPLPESPAVPSPRPSADHRTVSSPSVSKALASPMHRSPSMTSIERKSSSPALVRQASTTSLHNGDKSSTPSKLAARRSSSNVHSSSPSSVSAKSPLVAPMEESAPAPITAATVAAEYFARELALHAQEGSSADTVVILHDACYGHRYSRPRTSKSTLSMIVERPERIHASILGVSTAYVRLGGRHTGGEHAPHPRRAPSERLPFRIRRTSRAVGLTSPVVTNVHGTGWMQELKGMCDSAGRKLASTGKELSRSDENGTLPNKPVKEKFHEGDLYLCPESLDAFQGALGGVCDGVDAVFEGTKTGRGPSHAFVCVRPPGHHCSADFPSGFCWINNVHVGIEHAAQVHGLTHAAIIDFDLHHGDGSQAITWQHNSKVASMPKNTPNAKKTAIGYFSLHDINSYPCEYGDTEKVQNASLCLENAHGQSIWNVHLQPWKTEAEFWELYESRYRILIDKARLFLRSHTQRLRNSQHHPQPKAAIFLSAGFDASEWESQGMQRHKVNVPTEFYARFTRDVVSLAQEEGTGVDGRVISVLEGGYSDRALMTGVLSYLSGLCGTGPVRIKEEPIEESGLAYEMGKKLGGLSISEPNGKEPNGLESRYDARWWHVSELTVLEALVNPPPVAPPKKPRGAAAPTYFTPTQSFTAKVVDPTRINRTASGQLRHTSGTPSRAPSPPPPEVDWATAAHELSKLLIPTDRQTKSCRPEELSEPRAKKDRQSMAPAIAEPAPVSGRQLRDRRAKVPNYMDPVSDEEMLPVLRSVSDANRRKTIADVPMVVDTIEETIPIPRPQPSRRRQSVASSVSSMSGVAPSVSTTTSRATSVKPAANGVQVKKTRAPANARVDTSKATAATSRPPVPRIPSNVTNKPRTAKQNSDAAKMPPDSREASTEMDQLASAVQRISIKVPSNEEYEARLKKKTTDDAEKKKTAAKPPRKPAAPRTAKAAATAKKPAVTEEKIAEDAPREPPPAPQPAHAEPAVVPSAMEQDLPAAPQGAPLPLLFEPVSATTEAAPAPAIPALLSPQLPIPPASVDGLIPPPSPPRPDTPPPPPPTMHPRLQMLGPQTVPLTNPSQHQQLPPNLDPTQPTQAPAHPLHWPQTSNAHPPVGQGPKSPVRQQRGALPVFTADGVIPFGGSAGGATHVPSAGVAAGGDGLRVGEAEREREGTRGGEVVDVWEVPETPARG